MNKKESYTYDLVYTKTLEYFNGDELAATTWIKKYCLKDDKKNLYELTPDDSHRRYAKEFARVEYNYLQDLKNKRPNINGLSEVGSKRLSKILNYTLEELEEHFYSYLKGYKYIVPSGSVMENLGAGKPVSNSNCFFNGEVEDNVEDLYKTALSMAQVGKRRGGSGCDISHLRPKDATINNSAKISSGPIDWMQLYDITGKIIGQHCIEENQRVLTKNGLTKIKDVLPNIDEVWTKEGFVKVIDKFENGEKVVFKVITKMGYEVITSDEHIYHSSNEDNVIYKKLKELKVGDKISLLDGINITSDEIVKIEEIGLRNTYDLELEKEHLFWCEGFYVHNSRKMAMIISMDVNHPDILDFIKCKQNTNAITNANISIKFNSDFMKAVENDEDYILRFPCDLIVDEEVLKYNVEHIKEDYFSYNHLYNLVNIDGTHKGYIKRVKAKEIWNEFVYSNRNHAEPGFFNWEEVIDYDPSSVYEELKPCGTNPSLRKGTRVSTQNGIFEIQDLENKKFNLYNSKNELCEASCFLSGHNKELYKIILDGGHEYYATAEHKWLVNGKKITTNNLESGMYLPFIRDTKLYNGDLGTRDEGFFIGFLYGDGGWITERSNGDRQVGISINYEDYANFGNKLESILSLYTPVKFNERNNGTYEFNTTSQSLNNFLKKFKVNKKENGFTSIIWNQCSEEFRIGFIDGLFSADGCISKGDYRINFRTSHEKLKNDFCDLMGFYGIKTKLNVTKQKNIVSPNGKSYDKEYTNYMIRVGDAWSYNKFLTTFNITNPLKQSSLKEEQNNNYRAKYKNLIKIKSVEKTELKEDVWDITVYDETHTFLLSNCVTGNCGELPLGKNDSCRLISSNLYSLVENPFMNNGSFNEEKAQEVFYETQVMCDLIVDLEIEALNRIITKLEKENKKDYETDEIKLWKNIKKNAFNGRRTGTGYTALGDMLAALNKPYGEPVTIENMMRLKFTNELDASIDMAILKGKFPLYDFNKEYNTKQIYAEYMYGGTNKWYRMLYNEFPILFERMSIYGRRNIGLSTLAPNGTISIMTQSTSGVEPLFMPFYTRRRVVTPGETADYVDENGKGFKEFVVVHPKLKEYVIYKDLGNHTSEDTNSYNKDDWQRVYEQSPYYNQTANDINWEDRVKTQGLIQKYITSSISSTLNLPENTTVEEVDKIYKDVFKYDLKGCTVYRDGSRSGVLVATKEKKDDPCKDFITHSAPKRPKVLNGDFYKIKYKGQNYIIVIGLYCGKPYELFCFIPTLENIELKTSFNKIKEHTGTITKVKKNLYKFESDYITIPNLTEFNNEEERRHCTRTSLEMRHGIELEYIIKTFKKYDDTITSFSSVCARILNKYITNKEESKGEVCPECDGLNTLIHENGCKHCSNCGWQACS
jgi:ribonucleotide reductase alpha subunit